MKTFFLRLAHLFILLSFISTAWSGPACTTCGNPIRPGTRYFTANGKNYCSQDCFDATLPRCAACQGIVRQGVISNDKTYCSSACFETSLPVCSLCSHKATTGITTGIPLRFLCAACASQAPTCNSCGELARCDKLQDGRFICKRCGATAVKDEKTAERIIKNVRHLLREKFRIGTDHEIAYELVDQKQLASLSGKHGAAGEEMGLFLHKQNTLTTRTTSQSVAGNRVTQEEVETTDEYRIAILYGLSLQRFTEICAHELAHDFASEKWPNSVSNHMISEGFAEFIASKVNEVSGYGTMNQRMRENPHQTYGEGFRLFEKIFQQQGWQGVWNLMNRKK